MDDTAHPRDVILLLRLDTGAKPWRFRLYRRRPDGDESPVADFPVPQAHGEFRDLDRAVKSALRSGVTRGIADLTDVPRLGSGGLQLLVQAWSGFRTEKGELVFANPSPGVRDELELARLTPALTILDSLEEALRHFAGGERAGGSAGPLA